MEAAIKSNQMDMDKEENYPHSPRSLPTNCDVNSDPELIEGNVLSAEPLQSGSHRNISVSIQKLVQRNKRRGVENIPKPLAGGHELLLTHQELSGSGEDNRTLRRVEPIVLQSQGQKDKELVEEPKSFIHRPEEGIGNPNQLQKHAKGSRKDLRRRIKSQEPSGQGKRKSKFAQALPTGVQDPHSSIWPGLLWNSQ
ncbi:hypothetical protein O181_089251 [Austropuccinia psidii MF-1]|uniref:Uncharacterized protein n=1 Tax=Austropuccinia psidii MF-1 TaxID=1389203 RepID=A0A9Q3IT48_9BASI|nr:hypothetical protein [Austropuccinia psidii MF-1]